MESPKKSRAMTCSLPHLIHMPGITPLLRSRALALALLLARGTVALFAQNLAPSDWVYRTGEDATARAAAPARPFDLALSWERQGVHLQEPAGLSGEFVAPAAYRDAGLRYEFAIQAEQAELFFNGQSIGSAPGWGKDVSGLLPSDQVHWGERNRLVLKVRRHGWTGGEVRDFLRVLPASGAYPALGVEVLHSDPRHEYSDSAAITLPVRLGVQGAAKISGTVHWWVESDFHRPILDRHDPFSAGDGGQPLQLSLGKLAPGFYCVSLRFNWESWEVAKNFWIAVAPTKIASAPVRPEGFDAFWDRAKRELAAVPPEFALTPEPDLSTAKQKVFTVSMRSVGGVELKGWYVVPARAGRFPAVLHVPGYGQSMDAKPLLDGRDDIAHLALDVRGHGRSTQQLNPGFGVPGFVGHQIHDTESYIYRGAYLDCGRALEFLATRAEVDAARIAVEGASQGGGLAYATAALFPERVAACAAGVPFLGVPLDHFQIRTVYRDEMEQHLALAKTGTWDDTVRSLEMVDTANLADRIRCPVFMVVALRDDDCPPHIGFGVFNRLSVAKRYEILPDDGHMMGGRWPASALEWIRQRFAPPQ